MESFDAGAQGCLSWVGESERHRVAAARRDSHHRVRLWESLAGEGDDLCVARVVRRLDPDDPAGDLRVVLLEMVDELLLGDAGAEDEQAALRRQPPRDVVEEPLLVALSTRCVRVDVLPGLLSVVDVMMDVLAGEFEYLGDLAVNPDDRVMHS